MLREKGRLGNKIRIITGRIAVLALTAALALPQAGYGFAYAITDADMHDDSTAAAYEGSAAPDESRIVTMFAQDADPGSGQGAGTQGDAEAGADTELAGDAAKAAGPGSGDAAGDGENAGQTATAADAADGGDAVSADEGSSADQAAGADEAAEAATEKSASIEEDKDDSDKDKAKSKTRDRISAKKTKQTEKLDLNLRTLLGEKRTGYSVVQGGCTDGKYAYYLMVSPYNQKGRVLKLRISDNKVMAKSDVIDICHGNGMTLDTKRGRLVVVGRDELRNELTLINAGKKARSVPEFDRHVNVNYKHSEKWASNKSNFDSLGLSAISYVERYDCYVALQRRSHDLLVLDPDFTVIGFIGTKITSDYPGTYQAMDADERYVYLLLSAYNNSQPYNRILALDWNSEKLANYAAGKVKYVKKAWSCGEDGMPDADVRVKTPYEAENIYHVDDGKGKARFYLSEYHSNPKYHWTTKQQAYKVKWKKVTKKVKWKKVGGKWKYKTKKVWKYKTKYKEVKVYEIDYYNRDNYVYDLGIL